MGKQLTAKQAIRVWLASHDKTQGWLSTKVGVDEGLLSKVLSGARPATDELAEGLKRVTGVDLREFAKVA